MRIAHVITRMIIGGAQENTLLTCLDLRDRFGDEVLLITGPALGPEGSLMDRVRAAGLQHIEIDSLRRAIHPWRDMTSFRQLRRALAEFRPDVVHTHSAKGGILGRQAAWSLRVPVIVHTVHGAPFHPYQSAAARAAFRACERHAAGKCHALISVADAMTHLLVAAGVAPPEKFTTIYSGMEVEPFLQADRQRDETRRRLGYAHDHVVIGKVARLFALKGHEYVIEAAKTVVQSAPQARFLLVGDGTWRASLEQQIAAAGLREHFQFTGLVPPEQIPSLLAAMDIVVHASLREGLARVLPQALIVGRPVISFDIDGAREVVLPGETGLLVSPQSVPGLVAALTELIQDPPLRQRLAAEGGRRCTEMFRHQHCSQRIRELYQAVSVSSGPSAC
jgi:glycosyltransferase involved in cell wall biosynthesis